MDIKTALGILIQVLTIIASKTSSTVDDTILSLLKALQSSDALLAWVEGLFAANPDDPAAAISAHDPKLRAILDAHAATGAKAISIGDISNWLQYLPTIIALIQQLLKKPTPAT